MPKVTIIARKGQKRVDKLVPGVIELKLKTKLEKPKLTLKIKENKH